MDDSTRMAALQSKTGGAPPMEPPMAPPGMEEPSGMGGGMPPAEQVVPEIANVLKQLAGTVQDEDKKSMLMSAAEQLQAVFPSKPQAAESGMGESDSEAYGEPTPGM